MKKYSTLFLLLVLAAGVFVQTAKADATKTVGATGADYTTLKLAFDAINAGTITGAITLQVVDNTTETAAAVLNASLTGSANYTSVLIYPTVTGKTISGNLATPLIDLNGADNVTIDGRLYTAGVPGAAIDLTITNTSILNTAGTSTIRFINDATSNTVKYCTVKGSTLDANGGILFFSTTTGTTGNDGNTIDHNAITNAADANRPVNAIGSVGTSAKENSENTVSNNNIYDFHSRTLGSNGIYLYSNNSAWTISGNSFYEQSSFTPTAGYGNTMFVIYVYSTGVNFTVSGNYIGGNASGCSGTWTRLNSSYYANFYAIQMSVGTATASNIQGNTIKNMSFANISNWYGINAVGKVNIGTTLPNVIGAGTGNSSIAITYNAGGLSLYGISLNGAGTMDVRQNVIGSITPSSTSYVLNTYGIYSGASGTVNISNNTIGSTDAGTTNSIDVNATNPTAGNIQSVYGIYSQGAGTNTISGNTVSKMRNGSTNSDAATFGLIYGIKSTNGTNTIENNTVRDLTIANANSSNYIGSDTYSVLGISIFLNSVVLPQTVQGNTVYNLSNTNSSFTGGVLGLMFLGTAGQTNIVSKNFIYGLSVSGASTAASITGMALRNTSSANNIVTLGGDTKTTIYGMNIADANNLYFNTVSIGGSLGTGVTNKSYALYISAGTTVNIKNNIFSNTRSTINGSTLHYAANIIANPGVAFSYDYNDYYAPNAGGVVTFPLYPGKDVSSLQVNPSFASAGGTTAADYIPTASNLLAVTGTGVTTDYAGTSRNSSIPSIGAYEVGVTSNITVSATAGASGGGYSSLKSAFDAINAGTHQGDIILQLNSRTTEIDAAVLNASSSGSASYTSVTVYPAVTGLSISGNVNKPLIDLNGADNVTIDGRVNHSGSSKDLTITNTSIYSSGGTSTIRFINDATNNTVKYCTIKGSTLDASGGILFFSTTTGTTGNDGNLIDNNNITNSTDANRPLNAIYSLGTIAKTNSGNTISNNNIYDFLNKGTASNGIQLAANNTGWTISTNSFYETASFAPTVAVTYTPINNSDLTSTDVTISGNYIGGSAPSCGTTGSVTSWTKTNAFTNTFNAINLNVGPTVSTTTGVQGNTIKNFTWGDAAALASAWTAINIPATATGAVNIGTVTANTIGATTGNGSIAITAAATGANVYGINIGGTGTVVCQNNTVGAITAANASTLAANIYGINKTATAGTTTISNNTIGSTSDANSINASSGSTANAQVVYGILSAGTGTVAISGNTISKLTNGTTNTTAATLGRINGIYVSSGTNTITGNTVRDMTIANANNLTDHTAAVGGIVFNYTTAAVQTISGNTIYNLSNTYASFAGNVHGIYYNGSTTASTVSGNFINGLSVDAGSTAASIYGVKINAGVTTYANNIISLGGNTLSTLYGIYETGAASNNNSLYYNTVYIGGVPTAGALNSYALYSAASTNTRNFRNNIFSNARSNNGATGFHYAAFFNYATATNLTLGYNDYYAPGTGGVLGRYNSADVTTVPLIAGTDNGSVAANPSFENAGGTVATNYIPTAPSLTAVPGTGILTDYAGTTRSTLLPSMGAYEFTVTGNVSVTSTAGTPSGDYVNLKGAFDAINAGTHQGTITVKIDRSTYESASAVLNASSSPSSYSSVLLYPTASTLTISGSIAAPLIDLNGANAVTIDGRVSQTGSADLTISNASTSNATNTSTIRFIAEASNNTVKYCTIKGSNTSSTYGTIFFSTGTTNGNDGNVITNNTITSAGSNLPINAIYSAGSSTSIDNSGISITNNNIQDYSGAYPNGIYLASNSSAWTITGNRFFQTASRTISGKQRDINIVTASGVGYVINNNIIGYSSALGTGTSTFTGTANLIPIELTAGTSSASEIQGNTITAISFSTSTINIVGSGTFSGISVLGGTVNVGTTSANTIGAETGNGAITITPSAGTPWIQGIYATSTGTVGIQNNKIGSISVNGAATIGFTFYGINTAGAAGNFTISGNTIGSTSTANSIAVGTSGTTTSGVCTFYGINQTGTGTVSITGNTIQNCSAYGTGGSTFWGIYNTGSTGTTNISTNNILNGTLQGTGLLYGIYNTASPTALNISTNTIGTLTTASTSAAYGIVSTGAATTANINGNTISTISSSGASCTIFGINSTAGTTVNVYSNTVNALSGSGATSPIVNGINIGGGTTVNVHKNNIYNLSQSGAIATTAGAVNGMLISAGTTVYTYNNFISELKAPAANVLDAVRGISITSTTAPSTYGVYNNTVYLNASSSGTTFGSSGIYHSASTTATTSALDLRNNIIVNNSTPNGSGYTVAFKSGPGTAGYLVNYASTSTNNNFYAGTPGTYNVIYFDGTSSAQTLYAYKTGVFTAGTIAPRDTASISELPPFVNISSSPYDLRINTDSTTRCESRGSVVSAPIAFTADYYGTARYPNVGYPVNASYPPTLPDIGAHEFGGMTASGLSGTVNVGTGQTYTSLTNAGGLFEAIYNFGISGNLIALITSDLTSESGSIELTQWPGTKTLTISPSGGAARTVSGTVNGPLISLNGADTVIINGLNTESNSLIISNLSTGASASTIKFYNDATRNTIKNCTIKGSSTNASGGVIFFSTTTGTTGSDGNLIDNNNITNSTNANRPVNAIYALGTAGKDNSENTVSNNKIYDYINSTAASNGVQLGNYNSAWTISGNSLYETTSFNPSSVIYSGIYINNTGFNYTISNNYIGGSSANCAGTWTKSGTSNNIFYGIYLLTGAGTASNIQGNTIQNFTWLNSGAAGWTGIFTGSAGSVNIGTTAGNTIGSTTGSTSVTYTGGATGAFCYGMWITSTGTVDCRNNTIGLITADNSTSAASTNFMGIIKSGSGTTTISNNTIGSTTIANSINATSASSGNAQTVYGINSAGTGANTISGNIIANINNGTTNTTATTTGLIIGINVSSGTNTITGNTVRDMTIANANNLTNHTASVGGIVFNYTSAVAQTISANTIYNLSNTYASFSGNVAGIYYNGSTTASTVSGNFIHSLSVDAASTSANIYGVKINAGATTYSNNIISLGGNTTATLYGIYETGAASNNNNLYFNTVYIGGTPTSGALNSYALYSAVTTNTRDFRNNIFDNARSNNGATGKHYAAYFYYTTTPSIISSATGLTEDYNDYYASGIYGGTFGYFNGADVTSLASWKTATVQDGSSLNASPEFVNAGGTTAGDYKPAVAMAGVSGTVITTDYTGSTRSSNTMGAFDGTYNVWSGITNTAWETAANWSGGVPASGANVIIKSGSANMPLTGSSVTVGSLEMQSGTLLTLGADAQLNGVLTLSSGLITLGNYNLTLGSSAVVSGTPSATNMIVATGSGELRKTFTGTGSFTYPVGDNTVTAEYSPVTLNFTSGTFSSAYAGVKLSNAKHGNNSSAANYLNRNWTVTSSGISAFSCGVTMQYLPADVAGTEASIWAGKWNGTSWAYLNQADAVNHRLTATVTEFGSFSGGEQGVLPVELSSFTSTLNGRNIRLDWTTATEKNNYGFEVERTTTTGHPEQANAPIYDPVGKGNWTKIGFVEGNGTTNAPKSYSYTEKNISTGKYSYRLKLIDRDGKFEYSQQVEVTVSAPKIFALEQNYPNPFNPSTTINYQLPVAKHVSLKIYDAIGREVATLVNEVKDAGYYSAQFDGARFSSGIYFARLSSSGKTQMRKLLLLK